MPSFPSSELCEINFFKTFIRSSKKSMFTRWAYLEIPCNAAGRRGVDCGLFRMRKYRTKRSLRVSVCLRNYPRMMSLGKR